MKRSFIQAVTILNLVTFIFAGCSDGRSTDISPMDVSDLSVCEDAGPDAGDNMWGYERLIDNVNVFTGTGGIGFGVGSMIPGATAPFSMMKLSPDTAMSNGAVPFYHCAGYYYEDEFIVGFSHNHLPGVGIPDEGNILFMPVTDISDEIINWTRYRSPLDHKLEKASPGYYSVYLKDRDVSAELTVRYRSGLHRYIYKNNSGVDAIVVDLDASAGFVNVEEEEIVIDVDNNVFYGSARTAGAFARRYGGLKIYFYAVPDRKISHYRVYKNRKYVDGNTVKGDDIAAIISFEKSGRLNIRVGISYVDIDGARRNVDSEIADFNFDRYKADTERDWESLLSLVRIKTDNVRDKRIFYTAFYHLFQLPTIFTDVDGRYRGFDDEIHVAEDFVYYSDFSLWDTYRTFHPLISLLFPAIQRDFNISLLKMYEQGGYLPRWPMGRGDSGSMVGESADIVFADSIMRGITDWNIQRAYEAMLRSADKPKDPTSYYGGRSGLEEYLNLGYVAADKNNGSVSITQEYTYNDYAIAFVAKYLDKNDDYERFYERSRYYKNLFNRDLKFFVGRNSDGSWIKDFVPTSHSEHYVEGNGWHYRFFVPYDSNGLSDLFGGADELKGALRELFERSEEEYKNEPRTLLMRKYYWHSNEPCILIPYMFCDLGDCNLANRWVRWIFRTSYKDAPDGLPGNDDGGTMSAWYILSSIGLYTIPVRDYYLIGAPLFEEIKIDLRGNDLSIKAKNFSRDKYNVKRVIFNGRSIESFRIPHTDLVGGGELVIEYE